MDQLSKMAAEAGALLKARGETIAVAESAAGGLISAALLSIPGASAYFRGGAAIYTRPARKAFLIPAENQLEMRGGTEDYALVNARLVRDRLETDWGLSETGASGPTGNRYGDAAGHACCAVVGPKELAITIETGHGDREANMWHFAEQALKLLETALRG